MVDHHFPPFSTEVGVPKKQHEAHVLHGPALREPLSSPVSAGDAVGQSMAWHRAGWIFG